MTTTVKVLVAEMTRELVTDASGEAWVRDTETGAQSVALSADERAELERLDVELEPLSVEVERVDADDRAENEGPAYWVTARIAGHTYRLFAAPSADGRPGLEPCGDSIDDWCPVELRAAYSDGAADRLGREAIALAEL